VVATHAHADHSGGLRDFAAVACHASVAAALAAADPAATLAGPHYAPGDLSGLIVGPPRLAGPLVRALPAGFDPRRFGPQPLAAVQPLAEGDVIDLGDRRLTVLHVPGHSPGCIALHDPENGLLLSGDALYDDAEPVAGLHHSDPAAFSASLGRLARLQVRLVLPGHGEAFDGARLAARAAAWRALLG
jgi:glyoxylase-like metal-dependent hydrolase (beta-lactamase superfamily II)